MIKIINNNEYDIDILKRLINHQNKISNDIYKHINLHHFKYYISIYDRYIKVELKGVEFDDSNIIFIIYNKDDINDLYSNIKEYEIKNINSSIIIINKKGDKKNGK